MTNFCTVGPSAVTGERCGKPAVASFTSGGRTFHECAEHNTAPLFEVVAELSVSVAAHPKTKSRSPFLLVAGDEIVGYAQSAGDAVVKRARKLGAEIVANTNPDVAR